MEDDKATSSIDLDSLTPHVDEEDCDEVRFEHLVYSFLNKALII